MRYTYTINKVHQREKVTVGWEADEDITMTVQRLPDAYAYKVYDRKHDETRFYRLWEWNGLVWVCERRWKGALVR
jgi:hypothetical protein